MNKTENVILNFYTVYAKWKTKRSLNIFVENWSIIKTGEAEAKKLPKTVEGDPGYVNIWLLNSYFE